VRACSTCRRSLYLRSILQQQQGRYIVCIYVGRSIDACEIPRCMPRCIRKRPHAVCTTYCTIAASTILSTLGIITRTAHRSQPVKAANLGGRNEALADPGLLRCPTSERLSFVSHARHHFMQVAESSLDHVDSVCRGTSGV
jgi:hypothetical protein